MTLRISMKIKPTILIFLASAASMLAQTPPTAAGNDVISLSYPPSKQDGELSCEAHYYLWLPPGVKQVRGVIVHQHGCGQER